MLLADVIFSTVMFHLALSSTVSANSVDMNDFSEGLPVLQDFDMASSLSFDNSNPFFDFDSQTPSLEDDFFIDPATNTPLEDETFTSADPLLESSCVTGGSPGNFKRDGDSSVCTPRTDESPPSQPSFPTLDEIEKTVSSEPFFKNADVPSDMIYPITGYSRNDDECPWPKRRLCCTGPPTQSVPGYDYLHVTVNHCRGNIQTPTQKPFLCNIPLVTCHHDVDGVRMWLSQTLAPFHAPRSTTSAVKIFG